MNSKKILIVCSEFPPQAGGIGNHAYNLAIQFTKNGYTCSVLTNQRSKDTHLESSFDAVQNFEVLRMNRYRFILRTYINRLLVYRKLLKEFAPNIVMASGKFPLWLVAFGGYQKRLKKVVVVHGSEVNLQHTFQKRLVELALPKFKVVIAVSNYTMALAAHLKLQKVKVISNGFDASKFKSITEHKEELNGNPKLVTVGAMSQRKGQHNIIKALPELLKTHPDIHYHIVGIPSEKEKLQGLAIGLQVLHAVTFHDEVTQERLTTILSNSDIFVMLSEKTERGEVEGFGIALLEANYLGIPTIGATNCGIEDAIADTKSGILIDAHSIIELQHAIDEIIEHKERYQKGAKEWALQHKWELVIERYIEVLE